MRFRLKKHNFDAFSPIVHTATVENADRFHRKRIHLKPLSRAETFENEALSYQCGQQKRRLSKTLTSFMPQTSRTRLCADDCCSVFERFRARMNVRAF